MSRVVIRECSDRQEAETVRGLLEASGIRGEIEAEEGGSAAGATVWIDEADADQAHEALAAGSGQRAVLCSFTTRAEAEFACEMLRAGGIEARVFSDDCRAIDPALTFANGAQVLVPLADLERAQELLHTPVEGGGEEVP